MSRRVHDINRIGDAIDELLDRPRWSEHEFTFYQMLIKKVQQYREYLPKPIDPANPVKNIDDDVNEIAQNLKEQPWFKNSHNQGTLLGLITCMKIKKCLHHGNPRDLNYHYRLEIALGHTETLMLVMDVARDPRSSSSPPYHLRVYYETSGTRGHIAAFTPGNSKQKGHTLPEYVILERLLPRLARHEIICLAIEVLMYYDVDQVMAKLPMGNNYPITLSQLMDSITKTRPIELRI